MQQDDGRTMSEFPDIDGRAVNVERAGTLGRPHECGLKN